MMPVLSVGNLALLGPGHLGSPCSMATCSSRCRRHETACARRRPVVVKRGRAVHTGSESPASAYWSARHTPELRPRKLAKNFLGYVANGMRQAHPVYRRPFCHPRLIRSLTMPANSLPIQHKHRNARRVKSPPVAFASEVRSYYVGRNLPIAGPTSDRAIGPSALSRRRSA